MTDLKPGDRVRVRPEHVERYVERWAKLFRKGRAGTVEHVHGDHVFVTWDTLRKPRRPHDWRFTTQARWLEKIEEAET